MDVSQNFTLTLDKGTKRHSDQSGRAPWLMPRLFRPILELFWCKSSLSDHRRNQKHCVYKASWVILVVNLQSVWSLMFSFDQNFNSFQTLHAHFCPTPQVMFQRIYARLRRELFICPKGMSVLEEHVPHMKNEMKVFLSKQGILLISFESSIRGTLCE